MRATSLRPTGRLAATAGAVAGAAGAALLCHAGVQWFRYGHPPTATAQDRDLTLDRFMPVYDVVERHRIRVGAPAPLTLEVAEAFDLAGLPVVRAIFRARELLMRSTVPARTLPTGLIAQMRALGWGVLADMPGHEIVMGAVTRPWESNPVFRAVPADAFAAFDEPAYVKIAWTLRADPLGPDDSIFRTETRAMATDAVARERFRLYWSLLSPGIWVIRRASLRPMKRAAERAHRQGAERWGRATRTLPPA